MMTTLLVVPLIVVAAAFSLPGGPPVGMDYLAYDLARGRIWVPAGNTGSVDVIDLTTEKVTQLSGFPTTASPRPGRPNMGPSSAAIGDGVVWVGNRGDNTVCSIDSRTLKRRACLQIPSMPDGLAYVAPAHELWVTTPRDHSITIIDVKGRRPIVVYSLKLDGEPEGFAVDEARSRFYTNLEDRDRTLAIDITTRKVDASWPAGCGAEGPRGLAIDSPHALLFVACTSGAIAHDLVHDGKPVGRLQTGGGVDNIDYHARSRRLYVASGKDGTLTVARVGTGGEMTSLGTIPTAKGARNPIVDVAGTAYVADSLGGRLIIIQAPAP